MRTGSPPQPRNNATRPNAAITTTSCSRRTVSPIIVSTPPARLARTGCTKRKIATPPRATFGATKSAPVMRTPNARSKVNPGLSIAATPTNAGTATAAVHRRATGNGAPRGEFTQCAPGGSRESCSNTSSGACARGLPER